MTGRIFYYLHDAVQPSGGVGVLYEHVAVLRRAGFDAHILHNASGFLPTWLTPDVPIAYAQDRIALRSADVIVIPEDFTSAVRALAKFNCRRIIFCQNQYYAAAALHTLGDWRNFGIENVFASSETILDFLGVAGWPKATLVPYAIDPAKFTAAQKERQIALMPRKRRLDADFIAYTFLHKFPALRHWAWLRLDGVHRDEVARVMAQAAIFLTLGDHESMGLPALEAMLSGALVTGFHGDGDLGLPHAANAGLWVSSPLAAADALGTLASWFETDDPRAARLRQAGTEFAARYSLAARDLALISFWERMQL
jgi:hypothetical protein